ncbi:hypothetical protein SLA2020_368660 [Shorea laevis]
MQKGTGETMRADNKIIEDKRTPPIVHAVSHEDETRKIVKKTGMNPRHPHTIKYLEKKLEDKGVYRMERHPGDGRGIEQQPPKSGHGGKYTWEGPDDLADNELMAAPPAIDEKDPNYVDEEEEEKILKGEESDVAGTVVGVVEVAKVAEEREGVARVEVDPHLEVN